VIYQSMDLAFNRGRLTVLGEPGNEQFIPGPNVEIVDKANQAYLDMIAMEGNTIEGAPGYRSFLRKAVYSLYLHGRTKEAEKWWRKMKETYPDAVRPGLDLDNFVVEMVTEDATGTDIRKTTSVLEGQFTQAYYAMAVGEEDQAEVYLRLAKNIYDRYMTAVGCYDDPPDPDCERVRLPDLGVFADNVLVQLLDKELGLEPFYRARLLTALNLPEDFDPRADDAEANPPQGTQPSPAPNQ